MATNVVEQMLIELGFADSKFASEAEKAIKKNKELEKSLTDTEKASKKSEKANDELTKKQHNAIEQTAKFGEAIAKVTKELTGFFAIIIGSTGLFKLANDAARANMEVSKLSGQLGMNTRSITDWRNAAGAFGGSAEGMTASLTGIKQAMNGLVMFGDASMLPYFNALGVNVVDNAGKVRQLDDVMLDLADAFQKMPRDQAYTIGKKMGFDDGTINALVSGRKELQEILAIQKQMYHSDEKAIARSKELTKQQAILNAHWQSMKQMIGDALTPILISLIKVVNGFFEFLQKHEKVVTAVFKVAAVVIGMLLIPTLLSAGRALLGFIAPFTPLIRVFGLLGAAISPVTIAITALAAAFVLLYDDYKTWSEGGKSLFDWSSFVAGIKDSKMSVDTLRTAFSNLCSAISNNFMPTLKGYAEIISKLVRGDYDGAAKQAKEMIGTYSDIATGIIADATGEKKEDIADFIGESAYRLMHGGKDYYEQNGIEKPVDVNLPVRTDGGARNGTSGNVRITGKWSAVKENFVKKYYGAAAEVSRGLNGAISPEGILAQWAQETGWGQHKTPGTGYNLGNHKADKYWKGAKTKNKILDKRTGSWDYYRVYSEDDLAREHIKFLSTKRYAKVRSAKNDYEAFSAMQNAGYAEDKNYATHIMNRANEIKNHTRVIGIANGAAKAQQMLANNRQLSNKSTIKNDNRKQVNVNIPKIEVKTSSSTVSGNAVAAMKELQNYTFNQLGVSMT
jgi:flagellum-specific peptidoglycan hydrolase FlgJ